MDYYPAFLDASEADPLFKHLHLHLPWIQGQVKVFGKIYDEPRLSLWMGDAGYTYAGVPREPAAWDDRVRQLAERLSRFCGCEFNSVLLNLYRNGHDAMGMHRDNEKELGPTPCIASLSLGASRYFDFRHLTTAQKYRIDLGHGDLVVMHGDTQRDYKHGVPRQKRIEAPRINLTFRRIYATH